VNYFTLSRNISIVLCLAILSQACSKKIVPAVSRVPKTIAIEEIDFEFLHGKARLNYKDDKKEREVKANIRIHKDSVIWMTLSVIGVQGVKVLINKDSVTIVNYLDKEYYVYNYKELSRKLNFKIDYNVIQSAMLGNLIMPMDTTNRILEEANYNLLDQKQGTVLIRNYINNTTKKLEKIDLTEGVTQNSLKVEYSNFQPINEKSFPNTDIVNLSYKAVTGIINTTITIEYNKAEVGDKQLRFPFNIPKRYERR
jgi:Domain of unknown function (DUF4292)